MLCLRIGLRQLAGCKVRLLARCLRRKGRRLGLRGVGIWGVGIWGLGIWGLGIGI